MQGDPRGEEEGRKLIWTLIMSAIWLHVMLLFDNNMHGPTGQVGVSVR